MCILIVQCAHIKQYCLLRERERRCVYVCVRACMCADVRTCKCGGGEGRHRHRQRGDRHTHTERGGIETSLLYLASRDMICTCSCLICSSLSVMLMDSLSSRLSLVQFQREESWWGSPFTRRGSLIWTSPYKGATGMDCKKVKKCSRE